MRALEGCFDADEANARLVVVETALEGMPVVASLRQRLHIDIDAILQIKQMRKNATSLPRRLRSRSKLPKVDDGNMRLGPLPIVH